MNNQERFALCVQQAEDYPYRIDRMNNGTHWRVDVDGHAYDFWPHTGTWQNPRQHAMRGKAKDFHAFTKAVVATVARPVHGR